MRRKLIAIVGDTRMSRKGRKWALAVHLGRQLIDEGYRIVTGGLGDLPKAVARGARSSPRYREGDLVAILPGYDPRAVRGSADIVLASGIDHARNLLVANSDAVVAIGGGAGTLSEIALAWSLKRLVIGVRTAGWSGKLAGTRIDARKRLKRVTRDVVHPAKSADDVVRILGNQLRHYRSRHHGIRVRG